MQKEKTEEEKEAMWVEFYTYFKSYFRKWDADDNLPFWAKRIVLLDEERLYKSLENKKKEFAALKLAGKKTIAPTLGEIELLYGKVPNNSSDVDYEELKRRRKQNEDWEIKKACERFNLLDISKQREVFEFDRNLTISISEFENQISLRVMVRHNIFYRCFLLSHLSRP